MSASAVLRDWIAGLGRTDGMVAADQNGRNIVFTFGYGGRTWAIHADDKIERLLQFCDAMDQGRIEERTTRGGTRALWDGRIEGLYVYEVSSSRRDVRPDPSPREQPLCPKCFLHHAGECA